MSERVRAVSLATCRIAAVGPAPLDVALAIAYAVGRELENARAKDASAVAVTFDRVLVARDGSVRVAATSPAGLEGDSLRPPELVEDPRSDVYVLGVIVRTLAEKMPPSIESVVNAATSSDPDERFETSQGFRTALEHGAASAGIRAANASGIAAWAAQFFGEPTSSAQLSAPMSAPVSAPISSPVISAPMAIPDLNFGAAPRSMSRPSMKAVQAAPAPAPAAAPSIGGGDDDEFGMEIERNVAQVSVATATSSRTGPSSARTAAGPPSSARVSVAGSPRLEVAHVRRTSPVRVVDDGPSLGKRVGAAVAAAVLLAGFTAAFVHLGHHRGGLSLTSALPNAFDGSSAPASGIVSLVAVCVAVSLGFAGFKLHPRSWLLVAAGAPMLLAGLAMVTVTLSSTGENFAPPDGVLLLPYLLPASFFLLSLGLTGRSARLIWGHSVVRKVAVLPLMIVAGALLFVAFETSPLAR